MCVAWLHRFPNVCGRIEMYAAAGRGNAASRQATAKAVNSNPLVFILVPPAAALDSGTASRGEGTDAATWWGRHSCLPVFWWQTGMSAPRFSALLGPPSH